MEIWYNISTHVHCTLYNVHIASVPIWNWRKKMNEEVPIIYILANLDPALLCRKWCFDLGARTGDEGHFSWMTLSWKHKNCSTNRICARITENMPHYTSFLKTNAYRWQIVPSNASCFVTRVWLAEKIVWQQTTSKISFRHSSHWYGWKKKTWGYHLLRFFSSAFLW